MQLIPTDIASAFLIQLPQHHDARGTFIKTFHHSTLLNAGIAFELRESYYSISALGVIRGMHFQLPPHQHTKIVFCPAGKILDVVLDLRSASKTFGQHISAELSAANGMAMLIPEGCAHGFQSLEDAALTQYLVSSEYAPTADTGIRYDSFGMEWPLAIGRMSERDKGFEKFKDFESPF